MGFKLSRWDEKLLHFANLFETRMMNLEVNLLLEDALDYISDDELLEITPKSLRIRKLYLTEH